MEVKTDSRNAIVRRELERGGPRLWVGYLSREHLQHRFLMCDTMLSAFLKRYKSLSTKHTS